MALTASIIAFPAPAKEPCIDLAKRGLVPLYETGMACPGCRWRCWMVGRLLAECAHCGTALSMPDPQIGSGVFVSRGRRW